jgi:hypothetical protein
MSPRIRSGQLCTVEPVDPASLSPSDVVLCKVRGAQYLHFVTAIERDRYQIGNIRGHINGWVSASAIYGRLVRVEP